MWDDFKFPIIMIIVLILGFVLLIGGNPFAPQYTATVKVLDKSLSGQYGIQKASVEFLTPVNGYSVGDRDLFTVNNDYAQMVAGEQCVVVIRGEHILSANHKKE